MLYFFLKSRRALHSFPKQDGYLCEPTPLKASWDATVAFSSGLKKRPLTVIITVALYMGSKTLYSGQFCLYYLILGFDRSACWYINCQKCNSFHIQNGAFCLKKKDLKVFCTTFLKSDTNTVHLKIKVLGRERKNM